MLAMIDQQDAPWLSEVFNPGLPPARIQGTIKQTVDDFRVAEVLSDTPTGTGEHIYVDLTKRGANTAWVAGQLAEFCGVKSGDVGYAGRKDRHAVTRQWFSIYLPGQAAPDWTAFDAEGVTVNETIRHARKLRPGDLICNHFEIIVRHGDLSEADLEDLQHRTSHISQHGFPNYFGPQRFGRDLHNLNDADRLLRLKERVRGNRGMLISAARSWLFNKYLSDQIGSTSESEEMTGPLYGKARDPQPGEERLAPLYRDWIAGLRRLGAKVGERALWVVPGDFSWEPAEDHSRFSFTLPAGSFATSLLAELFMTEDAAL